MVDIVKVSQEQLKEALKNQIDSFNKDDHVVLITRWEKYPGEETAEKSTTIHICNNGRCMEDFEDED